MRNQFLSCLLGLAVALACTSPSSAQQPNDPLTRFLDSIFKPEANRPRSPAGQVAPQPTRPEQPAPRATPQTPTRAKVQAAPKPGATASPRPQPTRQVREAAPAKPREPTPDAQPDTNAAAAAAASGVSEQPKEVVVEQPKETANAAPVVEQPKVETAAPVEQPKAAAEEPKASASAASAKPAEEQPKANVTPVRAPAAPAPAARPIPNSPEAALERVNAYFNSIDQLTAYFTQSSTNGPRAEGTLFIKRPGQLHFAYAPPSTLEIVSDGRSVAVRDKKLGTNDVYSIRQTPLKFLVQEQVDLARDTKIRDVQVSPDGLVTVRFEDSATLGGTSKITLRFDARANALKQWTVLDAQGYETTVVLSGLNVVRRTSADAGN